MTPEQQQQYLAVLQLPPEVVNTLGPEQKQQVMEIRRLFGMA
jgi:hypothetical protein